jgi:hypothetical protein
MVSAAPGLLRARRWAALALLVLAAALTVRPMARDLADPAWPQPDEFQAQLDAWARILAPVESSVPAGEALAYACATDGGGRPLPELQTSFDFIQAVLAPRRIGRTLESRYVLAHFRAVEGQAPPSFDGARVLAELAKGLVLVERAGP